MIKLPVLFLLAFSLIVAGCGEEETTDSGTEVRYQASSVTCDGGSNQLGTVIYTITLNSTAATQVGLAGYTATPTACIGVYTVSASTFSEDNTFSFTRPDAASVCTDVETNPVTSCDVGGVSCALTSSNPDITISGTYTKTSTDLVLTYTATGNSICSTGETEVMTLAVQND